MTENKKITKDKDSKTLFSKIKAISAFDWIQSIGVIIALIFSAISLRKSNQSLDLAKREYEIDVVISARELDDSLINYIPFPKGDYLPSPDTTFGFLLIDVHLVIDNLSQRRISISKIDAIPLLKHSAIDDMQPFFTNAEDPKVTTNFNGLLNIQTANGLEPLVLPISLDQGESIAIIGSIGLPLIEDLSQIVSRIVSTNESITLGELKPKLICEGMLLDRSFVETLTDDNDECIPFPSDMTPPKLKYRFDLLTSQDTLHSTYLMISPIYMPGSIIGFDQLFDE
ncbi:MAG: hypothetical protein KKD28_09660 [Chloroflexi bacterium]|nr:hypothetical protein [Chloroflexota bacterium]MBU1661725.1 hypothetical protein [Chloroflexota bacterium]